MSALVFLAIGRVLKPVKDLTEGAKRIAGGDFGHTIAAASGDEIQDLAQQFNTMAAALNESHADLERKVEARTRELRESEERTRLIVETSYDAFIAIDANGSVTAWNTQAEATFGWPPSEAIGRRLADTIIPARYKEQHQRGLERFLATGEGPILNKRIELVGQHRDGHEFPVELTISPLRIGETYAFNAFVQDITERKRTEEALQQNADDLARSNAELEQFAYVASHDLQEPLRAIVGFNKLLERRYQGKLGEDADNFIARTVGAADRMQELINDLLEYSRVGTGFQELEPTDCDAVVSRVIDDLQPTIDEASAIVTHDPLPTVMASESMLSQVFGNLVSNAVKFYDEGLPQVHVSAELEDSEWVFCVRDDGIGIDPAYTERIFVVFQRLHSRAQYSGTGIGLAICKKAIDRLGGRIWVESQPGEGATFYFIIPATGSEAKAPTGRARQSMGIRLDGGD